MLLIEWLKNKEDDTPGIIERIAQDGCQSGVLPELLEQETISEMYMEFFSEISSVIQTYENEMLTKASYLFNEQYYLPINMVWAALEITSENIIEEDATMSAFR